MKTYKTEDEFMNGDGIWLYPKLTKFVESESKEYRWKFDKAYKDGFEEFTIIYKSYSTPEYRNFVLSISAKLVGDEYQFSVIKCVTDLA